MDIVIKGAAVGIIAALCALLIKKSNQEMGLVAAIAATAVICIAAAELFGSVFDVIHYAISRTGLSSAVFMPIVKCVLLAFVPFAVYPRALSRLTRRRSIRSSRWHPAWSSLRRRGR